MVYAPAAVGARLALACGSVRVSSDVHATSPSTTADHRVSDLMEVILASTERARIGGLRRRAARLSCSSCLAHVRRKQSTGAPSSGFQVGVLRRHHAQSHPVQRTTVNRPL